MQFERQEHLSRFRLGSAHRLKWPREDFVVGEDGGKQIPEVEADAFAFAWDLFTNALAGNVPGLPQPSSLPAGSTLNDTALDRALVAVAQSFRGYGNQWSTDLLQRILSVHDFVVRNERALLVLELGTRQGQRFVASPALVRAAASARITAVPVGHGEEQCDLDDQHLIALAKGDAHPPAGSA